MAATVALVVLRTIAASMFAAAMGSFAATVVLRLLVPEGGPVTTLLQAPFLTFGTALMLAAVVMRFVMPSRTEIVREIPAAGPVPPVVIWLLVALAVVAAARFPALWTWWQFGLGEVTTLRGADSDPVDWWLIPAAVVSASPGLAALTAAACAMTSMLGVTARATVTTRVVAAGTTLQAGLVAAGYVMRHQVSAIREAILPLLNDAEAAAVSARFDDWFTRQDLAAADANGYLLIVFLGYTVACVVSASRSGWTTHPTAEADAPASPAGAAAAPTPIAPARLPTRSAAPSAFVSPLYSVRPRIQWLEFLSGRHWEYVIDTIPPSARGRLSFSWGSGVLRQADGPELLRILPAERPGRFMAGDYRVQEAGTAMDVGRLVSRSSDWELLGAAGQTVAHVLEVQARAGSATYVMRVAGQDVCRATWGKHGLTIHSAELQLEFLPAADPQFDRGLAMAIAPILEQQARLKSERYT